MFVTVLTPVSFLGIILACCYFLGDFVLAPLFALTILGLTLYYSALFGLLLPAATLFLVGGILMIFIFYFYKKLPPKSGVLSLFLIFGVFFLFVSKWYGRFELETWDDFANWAYLVKFFNAGNRLFDQNSDLILKHYPPAVALVEYYFTRNSHLFENNLLLAHLFIYFSGLAALIFPLKSRPLLALALCLFALILGEEFGYRLFDVYRDKIISVYFAATLALIILTRQEFKEEFKEDFKVFVVIVALIAFMPLIKHIGFAFALVAISVYATLVGVDFYKKEISFSLLKAKLSQISILIAVAVMSYLSWKSYYHSIGVSDNYGGAVSLSNLIKFFFHPEGEKQIGVWREFYARAFTLKAFDLNYFTAWAPEFIALTLITFIYVYFLPPAERLRQGVSFLFVGLGSLAFLALLLMSYAYYFDDYEGPRLASFERYINSYLLAWALVLVVALSARYQALIRKPYFDLIPLILCGVIFTKDIKTYVEFFLPENLRQVEATKNLRKEVQGLAEILQRRLKPDERVYFIDQNTSGMSYIVFRYEAFPVKLNQSCWSVGQKYSDGDVWTCDIDLKEKLKDYRYLVVRKADQNFIASQHVDLRSGGDLLQGGVFKISYADGALKLDKID